MISMEKHNKNLTKDQNKKVKTQVYKPKMKVKFIAPFMYGGENSQSYRNFNKINTKNHVFDDKDTLSESKSQKDKENEIILGISKTGEGKAFNICGLNSLGKIYEFLDDENLEDKLKEIKIKGIAVSIGPEDADIK